MISFHIPDSISAMVYSMKHPYLWTLMVWTIAAVGYVLMAATSESLIPLAFATCVCITFVGCMPLIKGEHNTLHWVFGIAGCVLSQLWCILAAGFAPVLLWWCLWCVVMAVLLYADRARIWCLLMELWCMATVCAVGISNA